MKNDSKFIAIILAFPLGVGLSNNLMAFETTELEPNTINAPQNIDNDFGFGENLNIQNAEIWPWVSITGGGDGTYDYYSFEVPDAGGVSGVFDIDYGIDDQWVDMEVCLYTASGALVAGNDDSGVLDAGSTSPWDPYLSHEFAEPGTYVIGVRKTGGDCGPDPYGWRVLPEGATYELQVSLSQHQSDGSDTDEDGVPDDVDCDLSSDLNPTVVFAACDSGVTNRMVSDGCTIADLIVACAEGAKNHGTFSSCVAAVTNDLERNGKISDLGKLMIQSCAAQTGIGK